MAMLDSVYLDVHIAPTGVETFLRLSQNENGRTLIFTIVGGTIPSGSTVTISGTKPDGVVFSASGSMSGNVATFTESIQMTAVAGIWPAKLKVMNSGRTIATGRIRFVIDADTVKAGSVPSDSELEGLVAEAAQYAEDAKSAAYGSPLTAPTASAMIDKTRVYVYTGSESGYTNGDWYYWNGSAWVSGGKYNSTAVQTDKTLSISDMAADAKATGDAIKKVDDDFLRSLIYEQAGPAGIASFSDGADGLPLKSLILNIEPHQDGSGDPSPDNVRAISGYTRVNVMRAGKNIYEMRKTSASVNGITIAVNNDGTLAVSGTATGGEALISLLNNASQINAAFQKGGTFMMSLIGAEYEARSFNVSIAFITQSGQRRYILPGLATSIPAGSRLIGSHIYVANGDTIAQTSAFAVQLEHNDVVTDFATFKGVSYVITIPTSAGTVYGGELDVTNGKLKVDRVFIDLKSTTRLLTLQSTNKTDIKRLRIGDLTFKPAENNYVVPKELISNKYASIVAGTTGTYGGFTGVSVDAGGGLYICDPEIQTIDAWRASGATIVAPIATPEEYTLTPTEIRTLLGINNIWMDADGTVEAEYPADTKMYIDVLTAPDDDMIADSNIASGKYFTVNNRLYISTSAIAQGEAIVVGTNCTQTDLATALNAFNS